MNDGKILVVEDDERDMELLLDVLQEVGLDVQTCTSGLKAQALICRHSYAAVLLNLKLPDMDGGALMEWIHATFPDIIICIVTGHGDRRMHHHLIRSGAVRVFVKPYTSIDNYSLLSMLRVRSEAFSRGRKRKGFMGIHWKNPIVWLHGLVAAFIGGGAAAVSSGFVAVLQTPEQYNLHGGLANLLRMIVGVFVINGLIITAAYLQRSPLPQLVESETETTTTTKTVTEKSK